MRFPYRHRIDGLPQLLVRYPVYVTEHFDEEGKATVILGDDHVYFVCRGLNRKKLRLGPGQFAEGFQSRAVAENIHIAGNGWS